MSSTVPADCAARLLPRSCRAPPSGRLKSIIRSITRNMAGAADSDGAKPILVPAGVGYVTHSSTYFLVRLRRMLLAALACIQT